MKPQAATGPERAREFGHDASSGGTLVVVSGADDWRLTNQVRYLSGVALHWRTWSPSRPADAGGDWDHDHCAFCWVHFGDHIFEDDPDTQVAGFSTDDSVHWIGQTCCEDFHAQFGWVVATPRA